MHGHLARSCVLCDNDRQIFEFNQILTEVGALLKSHRYAHMLCDCDHGCDGREPLKGERCAYHKLRDEIEKLRS